MHYLSNYVKFEISFKNISFITMANIHRFVTFCQNEIHLEPTCCVISVESTNKSKFLAQSSKSSACIDQIFEVRNFNKAHVCDVKSLKANKNDR